MIDLDRGGCGNCGCDEPCELLLKAARQVLSGARLEVKFE